MIKTNTIQLFLLLLFNISVAQSEAPEETASNSLDDVLKKIHLSAYGAINYYAFDWETLPDKRNAIDQERFSIYLYYDFSPKIEFKSEIEFEHGGTGSTMDFDPLEEFGEFEQEIENGGEVVLEQLNLLFKLNPSFRIRVGKLKLYMGNASKRDEPGEYFTAYPSETENTILPFGWYETGIELSGDLRISTNEYPYFSYKAYLVSGLDNSAFNSANWVKRGYQTRFETVNADNLAYALRLDYIFKDDSEIGFSAYAGNTTGNRPKKDFTASSWLLLGDIHFTYEKHPWRISGYMMQGYLQNTEALSAANRNLSNNLNVKRTPVGERAIGTYLEAGYDLLHLFHKPANEQFYVFSRLEFYDSMYGTQGLISDNPRYERKAATFGFNYFPHPKIVFKTHYEWRTLGSGEHENTFALGMGFDF